MANLGYSAWSPQVCGTTSDPEKGSTWIWLKLDPNGDPNTHIATFSGSWTTQGRYITGFTSLYSGYTDTVLFLKPGNDATACVYGNGATIALPPGGSLSKAEVDQILVPERRLRSTSTPAASRAKTATSMYRTICCSTSTTSSSAVSFSDSRPLRSLPVIPPARSCKRLAAGSSELLGADHRTPIDLVRYDECDFGVGSSGGREDLVIRKELVGRKPRIENDEVLLPQRIEPSPWIASSTGMKSCSSSKSFEA